MEFVYDRPPPPLNNSFSQTLDKLSATTMLKPFTTYLICTHINLMGGPINKKMVTHTKLKCPKKHSWMILTSIIICKSMSEVLMLTRSYRNWKIVVNRELTSASLTQSIKISLVQWLNFRDQILEDYFLVKKLLFKIFLTKKFYFVELFQVKKMIYSVFFYN